MVHSIEEWSPDNAQVLVGGPRSLGRPRPVMLRRFNGSPVEPAVFTQIYDGESRQVYSTTSAPWVRVGQLNTSLSGSGSGALVGRSTVLTASHVVQNSWSPGGPVLGTVTFTPGMFDGTLVLGASWTANVIGIAAWEQFVGQDGYDMAICQLDQPFGDWLGYFGYRTYDDDWEDRTSGPTRGIRTTEHVRSVRATSWGSPSTTTTVTATTPSSWNPGRHRQRPVGWAVVGSLDQRRAADLRNAQWP